MMILIDYPAQSHGSKCPPPLTMTLAGRLVQLTAGLNPLDESTWHAIKKHPGLSDQHGLVPITLNRKDIAGLIEIIGRTWCAVGLDAIAAAEVGWYGESPRKVITDALARQRALVDGHAKVVAEKAERRQAKLQSTTSKTPDEPPTRKVKYKSDAKADNKADDAAPKAE